jgi:hypothetical protein
MEQAKRLSFIDKPVANFHDDLSPALLARLAESQTPALAVRLKKATFTSVLDTWQSPTAALF